MLLLYLVIFPVLVGPLLASLFFFPPPRCALNSFLQIVVAVILWIVFIFAGLKFLWAMLAVANAVTFTSTIYTSYLFVRLLKMTSGMNSIQSLSDLYQAATIGAEKSSILRNTFLTDEWLIDLRNRAVQEDRPDT